MNKIFITIHGIRKSFWKEPHLEGLRKSLISLGQRSKGVDYGYILIPFTNRIAVETTIKKLQPYLKQDSSITLIGYSSGAWAAIQVAEMGYPIDNLVLISPALHVSHAIPEKVKKVVVFYNTNDRATPIAKHIANFLTRFGFSHAWGEMGNKGYMGRDERVKNYKLPDYAGHSFYKFPSCVDYITQIILKEVSCVN